MAILNTIEGNAHVTVADDNRSWNGYILVPPDPGNMRYFHIAPLSAAKVVYEGPVLFQGKYYFGYGDVYVRKVDFNSQRLRVEFSSNTKFNIANELNGSPNDFITEE